MYSSKFFIKVSMAACLVVFVAAGAYSEALTHARVSYQTGQAMVKGTTDDDWSYATLNSMIMGGDMLWVERLGMLEVELPEATFLRMADGSKAEILDLSGSMALRGWLGSFYIHRFANSNRKVVFETPACSMEIKPDSMVRVDVLSEGATTITVRWGRVIVRTDFGGMTIITSGKRTYVDAGFLPSKPVSFNRSEEDAFDSWNRQRAEELVVGYDQTPDVFEGDYPLGYYDLNNYGDWVVVDGGNYWQPRVYDSFVPYRSGHWSYVSSYGYVWVGSHPFSYTTSHYGYWNYRPSYGWLWSYNRTWIPAGAMTLRYGPYFVWSPIDAYGFPVAYSGSYFSYGGNRFYWGLSSFSHASVLLNGYSPVYGCDPYGFNNLHHNVDIHHWNIDHHGSRPRQSRPDLNSSSRDYTPRRVIRGTDNINLGHDARTRISRLESTQGSRTFGRGLETGTRGMRTTQNAQGREARTRMASLDNEALNRTRTMRMDSVDPTATRSTRPGPTVRTGGPLRTRASRDVDGPSTQTPVRSGTPQRSETPDRNTTTRTPSPQQSPSGRSQRDTTSRPTRAAVPTSPASPGTRETTPERPSRNFTPTRQPAAPMPSTPSRTRQPAPSTPSRSSFTPTRQPAAPMPSTPSRTRQPAPSTPSRSSFTPTRQPAAPMPSRPSRTRQPAPSTPSRSSFTPTRQPAAPMPSTPSRTRQTVPSTPSRSSFTPTRQTAPQAPSQPSRMSAPSSFGRSSSPAPPMSSGSSSSRSTLSSRSSSGRSSSSFPSSPSSSSSRSQSNPSSSRSSRVGRR